MGTFFHPITLIASNGRSETLDASVEPDEMFALIPYAVLSRLDTYPDRSHRYRGQERGFGQMRAELNGQQGHITYMVATEDESPRIGRHTLDSFALDLDPDKQQLIPKVFYAVEHF